MTSPTVRQTLWTKLSEFPPIACRLLARTKTPRGGVRAMTVEEIAKAAGISVLEVNSLSWKASWDDVPYKSIRRFVEACGIDLTNRADLRKHAAYIRRGAPFKYLKRSSDWDGVYKPMIIAYVSTRSTVT